MLEKTELQIATVGFTVATNSGQGDLEIAFQDGNFECLNLLKIQHWEHEPHIVYIGCDGCLKKNVEVILTGR